MALSGVRAALTGLAVCGLACAGDAPLELVQATYFGTAENDDVQSGCAGPDGTFYLVGNTGAPYTGAVKAGAKTAFGADLPAPKCGHGFIAQVAADGRSILRYAELGAGIAILMTAQLNANGLYVGGYASEGLEPVIAGKPGLIQKYPLAELVKLVREEKISEAEGRKGPDPLADRPGLNRAGAPCVLRFSRDLKTVECGTYLEGWQQVWDKSRSIKKGKVSPGSPKRFFREFFWQPTLIAPLKSGDLMVCHDGGYFRLITDADRKFAAENAEKIVRENPDPPPPKKEGDPVPDKATRIENLRAEMLRRLAFYDVCDHLSRLSPDLAKRLYHQPIYTPPTVLEVAQRLKNNWPHPYFSNPRTHKMRLDKDENLYLCGWSASATKNEPYWDPYIWKVNTQDGSRIWRAYDYDPMGGRDNRMNGNVADTAVTAVNVDEEGNVLAALLSDGGNNYMGGSPTGEMGKSFEGPFKGVGGTGGLMHFHGRVVRFNGQTRQGLAGARTGPIAWTSDLAPLPGRHVLVAGRCNYGFQLTPDAWQKDDPDENPTSFVRAYTPDFDNAFTSALRGVILFEIVQLSEKRFLITGKSAGTLLRLKQQDDKTYMVGDEPNPGLTVTKDALYEKPLGKDDGYWLILEWKGSAAATGGAVAPADKF